MADKRKKPVTEDQEKNQEGSAKKPYVKPALYEYGDIERYTGSGSGMQAESSRKIGPTFFP